MFGSSTRKSAAAAVFDQPREDLPSILLALGVVLVVLVIVGAALEIAF
jgi:hypothetical protein